MAVARAANALRAAACGREIASLAFSRIGRDRDRSCCDGLVVGCDLVQCPPGSRVMEVVRDFDRSSRHCYSYRRLLLTEGNTLIVEKRSAKSFINCLPRSGSFIGGDGNSELYKRRFQRRIGPIAQSSGAEPAIVFEKTRLRLNIRSGFS